MTSHPPLKSCLKGVKVDTAQTSPSTKPPLKSCLKRVRIDTSQSSPSTKPPLKSCLKRVRIDTSQSSPSTNPPLKSSPKRVRIVNPQPGGSGCFLKAKPSSSQPKASTYSLPKSCFGKGAISARKKSLSFGSSSSVVQPVSSGVVAFILPVELMWDMGGGWGLIMVEYCH